MSTPQPTHRHAGGAPKTREEALRAIDLAIRGMLAVRALAEHNHNPSAPLVTNGEFYAYMVDDAAWWLEVAKLSYGIDADDLVRKGGGS